MVKSQLICSDLFIASPNTTFYIPIVGGLSAGSTTENYTKSNLRPAGTLSNLCIFLALNDTSSTSTLRVRKNGANGNQAVTISLSTSGFFEDTTNTDTTAAGDDINYSVVTGNPGASGLMITNLSMVFEYSDASIAVTKLANTFFPSFTTASVTRYATISGSSIAFGSTESNTQLKVKKAGTLKYLDVRVLTNARTTTTTIRTRKNTANGAQSVAITSTATGAFEDTTNSDTIAVDDLINYSMTTSTGTQIIDVGIIAVSFESSSKVVPFVSGSIDGTAIGATATYTNSLGGQIFYMGGSAELNCRLRLGDSVVFSNLQVKIISNTNNQASSVTLLKNSTFYSNMGVGIAASTSGTFEDTISTDPIDSGDTLTYFHTTGLTSTGSTTVAYFSCYATLAAEPSQNVKTEVVRFAKSTGANGTTQDVTFSFTPKAIIVMSTGQTTDATAQAHFQLIMGFSDGTTQGASCAGSEDAQANSDAGRIWRNDSVFVRLSETVPTTTVVCRGSVAFSTNKCTFTWTVNDAVATRITVWAFAGTDLQAKCVNTTVGRATAGTQNYTGLGFTPKGNGRTALFTHSATCSASNTVTDGAIINFGCATRASINSGLGAEARQWYFNVDSQGAAQATSNTSSVTGFDRNFLSTNGAGVFFFYGYLYAWISDGFTMNWDYMSSSASSYNFTYLVLDGGYWDSGTLDTPTAITANVDYPVAANDKTIKGLMLSSCTLTTNATISAHNIYTIGVTDGTTKNVIAALDEDNQGTMDSYRFTNSDGTMYHGLSGTGTTLDRGAFDSFGTNSFRLDYTVKQAQAQKIGWVILAGDDAQLYTKSITESSISVSDSNVRLLTANKTLGETISVSDSNARLLTAFRTFSESSISVSDANVRTKIGISALSESTITVSDTNARLLTAFRTISESSISVSDTLARIKTGIRALAESTITVSDSNTRLLIAQRILSEAAITVSETVAKLFTAVKSLSEASISVSDSVTGILLSNLFTRSITESTISVSETLARILTANRALSEASISVSDALTRFSLKVRSLSEPSISVSETLTRIAIRVRNISEGAISVSDSLSRFSLKLRAIAETVTVSDTLARIKTGIRAISEASITVSDSLARMLTANRAIADTVTVSDSLSRFSLKIRAIAETVSVSDTLARVLVILRSISEPSISVSDTLARIKIGVRAISEAVTVSDTLARTTVKLKAISEAAISVSDALAIDRTKIRSITEVPITVSEIVTRSITSLQRLLTEPSISVSDVVVGSMVVPVLATYITDSGYTNEVRMRVTFKSKVGDDASDPDTGDEVTFYQYDSFVPEARPFNILSWDLRLVQDEVSVATIDIEDHAGIITDKNKISFKAVVEIEFKKELGRDWQRMMTGFVRRIRTVRPGYNALIYRITVLSKQIIYNERVVNFKRAAKRSSIDSSIPLSTDSKMEANNLFRELHTATNIMPLKGPTVQKTGDFDLETGSISEEVKDFIAEIAPGLGTATDVARSIGEVTGAIWGTDEYGNPYLRYPTEKHSGIVLKDNPSDTDSAWNTSINMSAFEFEDIIDNSEGFANRLYVLNSKDTKSTASSSRGSGNTTLTTRWIAQSFIATDNNVTGAAFILSKVGNPTNTAGTIKGVLRASSANNNFPTGPTLATFEISLGSLSNSADVIFINDIKTANGVIVPGSRYWWVLQGTGLVDDTNTVRWHHDNDLATLDRPPSARLPLVDTDPTKPGNQFNWIFSAVGPVYAFSTFSSINHILTQSDSESIASTGTLVEAVVNLPAFNDDATYQKVLVQMLKSSSKIKRIYEYARVTIPTAKFFLPGELVTLIDSKASLQSEKVIHAEIVEVSYSMSSAIGCKYADLRLIGFIDPVLDNYLATHEC